MPRKEIRYFSAIAIAAIVMIAAFRLLTGTEARIGLIGFDGPRMMLLAKASRQTGIRVRGFPRIVCLYRVKITLPRPDLSECPRLEYQ